MKKTLISTCLIILIIFVTGCTVKKETIPAAPNGTKAVQDFVKSKKLTVKSLGFFDNFSVNDKKEVKWIDMAKEKDEMTKEVANEEMTFSLQFINDTAAIVLKKGGSFTATYSVVELKEKEGEDEPGVRLKLTYLDPEMSFGGVASAATYSFVVLGLDDKRMMLQTPRSINRQPLISIMSE